MDKQQQKTTVKQWIALAAMGLGVFMGLLDVTVVNVALPTMVKDFNTTFTDLQWVLNAYTLVYAVTLMIMSKLGDMYGRKKIFLGSLILFVVASAVNGMAPSLLILDIGRGVQAIGGAGMMSLSMALVASNFAGRQRGLALGILGSVIGISTASGPLVGGYLVENFGWPAIFYVNVPFGILAVVLTIVYVKETPSYGKNQKIDVGGMLLSAIGLFAIIYGLIVKEGHPRWSWTNPEIAILLIGGIAVMSLFIFVESRVTHPMINLGMFKERHFVGTVIVAFALGSGIYAYNAFLTALMQNYIGYSAIETGVRQLVMSVWSLVLGPVVGLLTARFSSKWMISIGMLIGSIGYLAIAWVIAPGVSFLELWPGMVMIGITNAIVNPVLNTAGMAGVAPHEMGMASGLLNVFRQFGTTVGVVGLGLIQNNSYMAHLNTALPQVKMPTQALNGIKDALINAGPFSGHTIAFSARLAKSPFAHQIQTIVVRAFDNGMIALTMTAAVIALIGALAAVLLLRTHQQSQKLDLKAARN
jgi:EmrB/QacA subfamily drug resistance transporter